jgi:hypothetical protein
MSGVIPHEGNVPFSVMLGSQDLAIEIASSRAHAQVWLRFCATWDIEGVEYVLAHAYWAKTELDLYQLSTTF